MVVLEGQYIVRIREQEILGNTQFLQLRARSKTASEEALKANEQEERDLDASLVHSVERLKVLDAQQHDWQDRYDEGQAFHDDIYKERMDKLEASQEDLNRVFQAYYLGASHQSDVIFWQIDEHMQVHTGHVMCYDPQGHRQRPRQFRGRGRP